jgi:hypothetical protein
MSAVITRFYIKSMVRQALLQKCFTTLGIQALPRQHSNAVSIRLSDSFKPIRIFVLGAKQPKLRCLYLRTENKCHVFSKLHPMPGPTGPPESTPSLTKMPLSKNVRDFYPNRFGQFLSEIGTMHSPNPIFIQIPDEAFKTCFFLLSHCAPSLCLWHRRDSNLQRQRVGNLSKT